jgi:hypothetical protein
MKERLVHRIAIPLAAISACLGLATPAHAQRVVSKIGNICPLGYVDTFNGKCSTLGLMNYTLQPTNGQACPSGWMNVGGGYCRQK